MPKKDFGERIENEKEKRHDRYSKDRTFLQTLFFHFVAGNGLRGNDCVAYQLLLVVPLRFGKYHIAH